jgi:hypothetical protein
MHRYAPSIPSAVAGSISIRRPPHRLEASENIQSNNPSAQLLASMRYAIRTGRAVAVSKAASIESTCGKKTSVEVVDDVAAAPAIAGEAPWNFPNFRTNRLININGLRLISQLPGVTGLGDTDRRHRACAN